MLDRPCWIGRWGIDPGDVIGRQELMLHQPSDGQDRKAALCHRQGRGLGYRQRHGSDGHPGGQLHSDANPEEFGDQHDLPRRDSRAAKPVIRRVGIRDRARLGHPILTVAKAVMGRESTADAPALANARIDEWAGHPTRIAGKDRECGAAGTLHRTSRTSWGSGKGSHAG